MQWLCMRLTVSFFVKISRVAQQESKQKRRVSLQLTVLLENQTGRSCSHHHSNADLSGGSIFLEELYRRSCQVATLFVPMSQASCKIMLCHAYNLSLKRRRLQRGQNTLEGSPLSEPSLSVCLLIS